MTFQEAAAESAQLYYKFLEENGGGLITYRVSKIVPDKNSFKKNEFWLQLDQKPKNTDSLMIRIQNYVYSNEQIKPVVYNSHNRMLKVSLSDSTKGVFDRCRPEDVFVFSDLKFLVRRVEAWYKRFGDRIKLPDGKRSISPADCSMLSKTPSPDQSRAVQGALSEPFTYVWGAPGTGKTQFVLARSVLAYIQAGKRILVTAPTNNAVEQTLYGILPVLKEAGLDYNKLVIRLGTANADFLSKYPGVCEDSGYSRAITEILDTISVLQISLEENAQEERLYNEFQAFQQKRSSFMESTEPLKDLMPRISEAGEELLNDQSLVDEILAGIAQKENEKKECNNSQEFYNRQAQDLLKRLHNPIYAVLSWFNKEEEQKKIDTALEKARYYEEKLVRIQSELDSLNDEAERRQDTLTKVKAEFETLLIETLRLTAPYAELSAAAKAIRPENADSSVQKLAATCDEKRLSFDSESGKYESVTERDSAFFQEERRQIEQQIQLLEQKKEELEQADPGKRMEECQVIACTIDLCLNRLPVSGEHHFAHVFLDEAGYSSLIKATTLTAYGDKVTFLGDHMQLPPVCEADDREIRKENLFLLALWAQSALFTETVFSEEPEDLCMDYLNKTPIPFVAMKKFNLVNSYRFGEALARVLAADVYDRSFRGNDGQDTRIYYLDAPKRPELKKRVSQSECEVIEKLLRNYGGLRETSGIIAPYRNQVEALKQMAKRTRFPLDSVVTVHQSQGREWDNVLLSVTDTTDMFFTNSLSPVSDGKKVINTAVSRAKKNLILVCDYQYWIRQRSQLIGKLLAVAEPLDTEK